MTTRQIEDKETDYVYFPDSEQLLENGCYYFKLSFCPEFDYNNNFSYNKRTQNLNNDFTKQIEQIATELSNKFLEWNKEKTGEDVVEKGIFDVVKELDFGGLGDFVTNRLKGMYNYFFRDYAISKTLDIRRILMESIAKITAEQMINDVEFKQIENKTNEISFNVSLYENQTLNTMNVFLPFNSMSIKRESGISSADNIMGSIYKNMILKEYNKMIASSKLEGTYAAQGYSNNKYKGFVLSNIPFETYSMEWDLMPHNRDEMMNILTILTYFQCCCLSSINLNDRDNMKMVLPPKCEMGIITSKHDITNNREEQVRNRLVDYSFNYVTSYNPNRNTQRFNAGEAFKDTNKSKSIHWLKPPVPVYISSVDFEPLSNSGGVLLSPEGYPMGFKLKVNVCRTEMTTIDDLTNKNKDFKKANPFA